MPLASRVANLNPEGAYAVIACAQALEAEGCHIIHLEIGQPDFETYPHIKQEGIQAIQDGFTCYNPPAGIPELRKVIAEKAGAQRGIQIDPLQVVIGPGAKPSLFFPSLALIEPGEDIDLAIERIASFLNKQD